MTTTQNAAIFRLPVPILRKIIQLADAEAIVSSVSRDFYIIVNNTQPLAPPDEESDSESEGEDDCDESSESEGEDDSDENSDDGWLGLTRYYLNH